MLTAIPRKFANDLQCLPQGSPDGSAKRIVLGILTLCLFKVRCSGGLPELQDKHGADVNIVLFMLWVADQGRRLSADDIGRITNLIADWQNELVRPLRLARRF